MKKTKKGFTLVELLVVIAIIAILAAIIAPNAFKAIEKSKVATAESDYRAVKTATLGYYADNGKWPVNGEGLMKEPTAPADTVANWNGPYLEKWKDKNPWGGDYTLGNKTLTLSNVPQNAAEKIDEDLDGAKDGANGIVIYNSGSFPTSVSITLAQ